MKFAAICLSIALILCSFCGCTSEKTTVSVAYDLSANPSNIDPQNASAQNAMILLHHTMEGLYRIGENGAVEPALAGETSITNGGTVYTFTLREDAQWYYLDEQKNEQSMPLTAEDFVFAFRRLLRADTRSSAATRFYCIKNAEAVHTGAMAENQLGVKALNDRTVQFTLNAPNDSFLYLLTTTYALPCNEDFFESTRGRYGLDKDTVLSNSAYRISYWDPSDQIRLAKNALYYDADSILADQIRLRITKDSAVRTDVKRLSEETVDAMLLPGALTADLSASDYQITTLENEVWGLLLNQENETLANAKLRKAITLCFDRSVYASLLPSHLTVAESLVPSSTALFNTAYTSDAVAPSLNVEKAQELYDEALAELEKSSVNDLTLLVNGDADLDLTSFFLPLSQILQRDLSMYIRIETVNASTYQSRLSSGNYDLAIVSYAAADNSVLTYLEAFATDASANKSRYSNESFDAQFNALAQTETTAESQRICQKLEQTVLNDGVFLPMFFASDAFITRADTSGIVYDPLTGLLDLRDTVFH